MADYEHGSMDVTTHEKDYGRFVQFSGWVCFVVFLVLVFLAIFNG